MDLQSTFYSIAIAFIGLWMIFLSVLIIGGILLFKKIMRIQGAVEQKLKNPTASVLFTLAPILPTVFVILTKLFGRRR